MWHAEEQGGKHVPFGGLGGGYYSDNTKGCYDVINNAKPIMMEACASAPGARVGTAGVAARNESAQKCWRWPAGSPDDGDDPDRAP